MIFNREKVPEIKEKYPVGTRIRLIRMGGPPEKDPIVPGSVGTVLFVDDIGTIGMNWDSGRRLGLLPEIDQFEIVPEGDSSGREQ